MAGTGTIYKIDGGFKEGNGQEVDGWDIEEQLNMFDYTQNFTTDQLRETYEPSTTSLVPPAEKVKTKGRPSSKPAVPLWEKEFCKVVGSLDWKIFSCKKKFVHLYDNVMIWDDSESKDAFQNTKTRFWSEKHGVLCDIPLPDPDLYIDKIYCDLENDIKLRFDLDINPVFPDRDENRVPVVIFGDYFLLISTNSTSVNHVDPWEHNWGNAFPNAAPIGWT
ncbi:uncharacterized protein Fot_31401 [Forsythia ovata]|uniref:Uncharacterized protein n=1 Tax=Forsythia ovata TaxID=205694 RepID=A0ABD1T4U2_9LAMI